MTPGDDMEEVLTKAEDRDLLAFAKGFLGSYGTYGFQCLNKRDADLLLFYALETSGVLDSRNSNHEAARMLRLTPRRLAALRRDAWARWAARADVQKHLADTLRAAFQVKALKRVLAENLKSWKDDRLLPILLEHPSGHAEVEQFLKSVHSIPHYARNREVLLLPHDQVLPLLETASEALDTKRVREIKKSFAASTTLQEYLTEDISRLTWDQTRSVLNNTVGAMLEKAAVDGAAKGISALVLGVLGAG